MKRREKILIKNSQIVGLKVVCIKINIMKTYFYCLDKENRLSAVADNNYLSHYFYDASGERVWKHTGEVQLMQINLEQFVNTANITNTTLYTSPTWLSTITNIPNTII